MLCSCPVDCADNRRIISHQHKHENGALQGIILIRSWVAKVLVLSAAVILTPAPATAQTCAAFRPTRLDTRNVNLDRPVVVLPAHFNGDGLLDVTVVNRYSPGTLLTGSVSVLAGRFDGQFTLSSTQATTGGTNWAAVGDFDNDRIPDIAAVNDDSVTIFMGDGIGGFSPQTTIPTGFDSVHIMVAEMTGDGNPDLVIVQQYIGQSTGRVVVLRGNGSGGFTPMTAAPVAQSPIAGVTGDFDGDGVLDVVTASTLTGNVSFLKGLGNGNFAPRINSGIGVSGSSFLAAADFDGDGPLDLAVTSEDTGISLLIVHGYGNGTFVVTDTRVTGSTPRNPVLCDFDRNGWIDIAVPNQGSSTVSVLYNQLGAGFSVPTNFGTDGGPTQASIADLNFDGYCDVITANTANSVSVLVGGVRGTLGAPSIDAGNSPLGAAPADFNGDGNLDLAVANRDDNTVSVLRGDGEGGMFLSQTVAVATAPGSVASGDFNIDGFPDLAVASQGSASSIQNDSVQILYNDTTGGFSVGHTLTVGDLPLDVKSADFNFDGLDDIVVANSRSDKVSFYFSLPGNAFSNVKNIRIGSPQRSLAVGDFNSDGLLDVAAGHMGENAFTVVLATPQFGFQSGPTTSLGGTGILDSLAAGDLDGDLITDLAVISQSSDPFGNGTLTILPGTGQGGFFTNPFPGLQTGAVPEALSIMDLDRQFGLDIMVANRLENDILTFLGDGSGHFSPGDRFGTGSDPISLATGDFNGDMRTDLLAVNFTEGDVAILLNNTMIVDQITSLEYSDQSTMVWNPVPGASHYRVYRDNLSLLSAGNYGRCLGAAITSLQYSDTAIPPDNDGFFYLVSVVKNGVESPLGYSSICVSEPNFNPCLSP